MAVHYSLQYLPQQHSFFSFLKVDLTSLRSIPVHWRHAVYSQVHQLSSFLFEFSLSSEISFATFFFLLSANLWRTCRHLISYVCLFLCWAAKDWTDSADCALHAGHVRFFLCLKMSFLSDDSSMIFILHLKRFTFLGHHQKSDRTFLPLMQRTLGHFCCVEVRASAPGAKCAPSVCGAAAWGCAKRLQEKTHTPLTALSFTAACIGLKITHIMFHNNLK